MARNKRLSRGSRAVAVLLAAFATSIGAAALPPGDDAEVAAQHLRTHAANAKRLAAHADCLLFLIEESTPQRIEVAVHEQHGDGCPGDPATMPVLDRYRIDRASGAIERYDVAEDEYRADK